MINEIDKLIENTLKLKLGVNKKNEIKRLVFEIHKRENSSPAKIFKEPALLALVDDKNTGYLGKFINIKKYLILRRYPNAAGQKDFEVFLNTSFKKEEKPARIYSGRFYPEHIFIENAALGSKLAKDLAGLFPDVKIEHIESIKKYKDQRGPDTSDPAKRDIFVTTQNWDFIKACPCTKGVKNCNYHIINLGFGCPFDCTYCYLQQYTNFRGIILDSNISGFLDNTDKYLSNCSKFTRIGTGEFTDSLALDDITGYSKVLVPYFADKNVLFELKTKSNNINNLAGLEHNGKTLVSWSLNPENIVQSEENGTASLKERLDASKICYNYGYKIGFHFDPIIHYDNWEKDYEDLVNRMCDTVPEIEWISLGTFRFNRALKPVIERRFPETKYIYGELIIGHDKKLRYYENLRLDIYRKMYKWIRKRNKKSAVYLCMEPKDMWESVIGQDKPYWL